MKINDGGRARMKVLDLEYGDVFRVAERDHSPAMMRMPNVNGSVTGTITEEDKVNAVILENGEPEWVSPDEEVILYPDAEIFLNGGKGE